MIYGDNVPIGEITYCHQSKIEAKKNHLVPQPAQLLGDLLRGPELEVESAALRKHEQIESILDLNQLVVQDLQIKIKHVYKSLGNNRSVVISVQKTWLPSSALVSELAN